MKGHITKTSVQRNADRTEINISMNSNNYVYKWLYIINERLITLRFFFFVCFLFQLNLIYF